MPSRTPYYLQKNPSKRLIPLFIKGLTDFDIDEDTFNEAKALLLKRIEKNSEDWFQDRV